MPFTLSQAAEKDIPALIEFFFDAFANDPLIMTCYPATSANREWWLNTILTQMKHPSTVVMKVIEGDTGEAVSFAKWSIQQRTSSEEASGAVQPNEPSPDMNVEACKSLADAQYKMRSALMGDRDHICELSPVPPNANNCHRHGISGLNALATSPKYQCQGAATMLVQWGTDRAKESGLECFSACTNTAKANVHRILERAGWTLKGSEIVLPDLGLGIVGGWKGAV